MSEHEPTGADVPIPQIDQETLAARLDGGDAFVVDVREAREYRPAHVPGAVNVQLSVLPARVGEMPTDRPVHVICESGGRSATATELLRSVGIDATDVAGGTSSWIAAGRPVRSSS
jgi:rhodanese-related sulfurtransferase